MTRAHSEPARKETPADPASRPTYSGLRDRAKGPPAMTVVVAPPGSSAVR